MEINQRLLKHTIKEVDRLKKYATKEQKDKLSPNIDPGMFRECIYGQMTGHCLSKEAKDLITKCCSKTVHGGIWSDRAKILNKSEISKRLVKPRTNKGLNSKDSYWSPLESFIYTYEEFTPGIVEYIKGKRKTLNIRSLVE